MSGALLVVPSRRAYAQALASDENGPKVQILSPSYQDVLKAKARILVGIAAGQYNPVTIELWVDVRPVTRPLPLSSLGSMSFDWDTRRFTDGPHKLSIRVTDTQGFSGLKEVNVYINNGDKHDTVAPDLKWRNIAPFQQLSGQAQLSLASKGSFGVKWIIVKVTPTEKTNMSAGRSWVIVRPPYTFKFDTTKVADGVYALTAKAWDALDQEGNAPTLTLGVVNSPINATTVGQSLDGLRQMAEVEKGKRLVSAPALPSLTVKSASSGRSLSSAQVVPGTSLKATVPSPSAPTSGLLAPQLAPRFGASPRSADNSALMTRKAAPGLQARPSTGATAASVSGKTFIARLGAPSTPARAEQPDAALSKQPDASPLAASSQVQAPVVEAPVVSRTEVARLTLPSEEAHALDIAPVLSSARSLESLTAPQVQVASPSTLRIGETLIASVPASQPEVAPRALSRPSKSAKVVLTHETRRYETKRLETTRVATAPAQSAEIEPMTVPQLSAPRSTNPTVVAPKAPPSKLSKIAPRIAALPSRPRTDAGADAQNGGPDDAHPAITVSPVQAAFNSAIPATHLVKVESTLSAIAEHYGLPVEMVAVANNWNPNMRVIPGMVVQLPRQVKLSLNGHPVGGDVASMLVGDTTVTAMRFLFEQTGGKLEWDAQKQEVIARKGASTIRVKIGSKVASVNNKQVMMQLAAFLFEGRTMVPARFFEEGLNAEVEWNPENGHLVVAMAN